MTVQIIIIIYFTTYSFRVSAASILSLYVPITLSSASKRKIHWNEIAHLPNGWEKKKNWKSFQFGTQTQMRTWWGFGRWQQNHESERFTTHKINAKWFGFIRMCGLASLASMANRNFGEARERWWRGAENISNKFPNFIHCWVETITFSLWTQFACSSCRSPAKCRLLLTFLTVISDLYTSRLPRQSSEEEKETEIEVECGVVGELYSVKENCRRNSVHIVSVEVTTSGHYNVFDWI